MSGTLNRNGTARSVSVEALDRSTLNPFKDGLVLVFLRPLKVAPDAVACES